MICEAIYVVGDIHSDWDLWMKQIEAFDLRDCCFIHCGDGGEGFLPFSFWEDLNEICKNRGIYFLNIRGNHSDPSLFRGKTRVQYSNLEFLEDYTYREINGLKFLFVGGAISVDRIGRRKGVSYWPDEKFVLDKSKVKVCDVLVTHSAPIWNGPISKANIQQQTKYDPTLWDECCKERRDITELITLCECKKHFCGHFHEDMVAEQEGCRSRILGKVKIVELIWT